MKPTLALTALGIAAAMVSPLPWLAVMAAAALAIAVVVDSRLLRCLKRPSLWIMSLLLIAGQPLLLGTPDASLAGIPYSTASLEAGVSMTVRALLMIVLFGFVTRRMKRLPAAEVWGRMGLHEFGEALAQAERLLPDLEQSVRRLSLRFTPARRSGWGSTMIVEVLSSGLASILTASRHHDDMSVHSPDERIHHANRNDSLAAHHRTGLAGRPGGRRQHGDLRAR